MADIFEIKKEKSKNKKIAKFYEKAMKELIDFYGVNWTENRPKVILADSRKTFEILVGRETRDWVVGTVLKPNTVVLLSPENFEKESFKKDFEKFFKIKLGYEFFNNYLLTL